MALRFPVTIQQSIKKTRKLPERLACPKLNFLNVHIIINVHITDYFTVIKIYLKY